MLTPAILDGTRPAEEYTLGPGRLAHAFPDGANIALCGVTRSNRAGQACDSKCGQCVRLSRLRDWSAR